MPKQPRRRLRQSENYSGLTLAEFKNQVYGEDFYNISKQNSKALPIHTLDYQNDYLPKKVRARSARRARGTFSAKSIELGVGDTGEMTLHTTAEAEVKNMLPSKFSRTRSFNLYMPPEKERSDDRPVGPASYEKEPIVGNPSMAQFKNQPSYSIPQSSTGRMAANRSTSSSLQRYQRN